MLVSCDLIGPPAKEGEVKRRARTTIPCCLNDERAIPAATRAQNEAHRLDCRSSRISMVFFDRHF
jgi:hypothetical protein